MILRERKLFLHFPGWQVGYSGFTYHISSKESLISYVRNQAEHHKTVSFKDELIRLLKEHNVDYIDDYLFTWYSSTPLVLKIAPALLPWMKPWILDLDASGIIVLFNHLQYCMSYKKKLDNHRIYWFLQEPLGIRLRRCVQRVE